LTNFGVLPLVLGEPEDYERIEVGDELELPAIRRRLEADEELVLDNRTRGERYAMRHTLTRRQLDMNLAGSLINLFRDGSS
jgi:aconitate hydratase